MISISTADKYRLTGLLTAAQLLLAPACLASPFELGVASSSHLTNAEVLSSPSPEIPAELHDHCFKSCCIARFTINPDGKTSVKLLTSSGSPDIDEITLNTLRRWKFKPATVNGEPVASTRKIRVEFEIE